MHTGKLSMVGNMKAFACLVHFRFLTYTILKAFFFFFFGPLLCTDGRTDRGHFKSNRIQGQLLSLNTLKNYVETQMGAKSRDGNTAN